MYANGSTTHNFVNSVHSHRHTFRTIDINKNAKDYFHSLGKILSNGAEIKARAHTHKPHTFPFTTNKPNTRRKRRKIQTTHWASGVAFSKSPVVGNKL